MYRSIFFKQVPHITVFPCSWDLTHEHLDGISIWLGLLGVHGSENKSSAGNEYDALLFEHLGLFVLFLHLNLLWLNC